MEIIVLTDKFEVIAEIDKFTSFMWCERAFDIGALDLQIEANENNLKIFQIGYFIFRKDINGICRIDSIEMKSDSEIGDQLIIGAVELKCFTEQITIHGEYEAEKKVYAESWIREAMKVFTSNNSTILPKTIYRNFLIENFNLGNVKNYEDVATLLDEKNATLNEHINYICEMVGMTYKINYDYDSNSLNLDIIKGKNRSVSQDENNRVLFSKTFDNLQSSKISQSIGSMCNVAVVTHNNGAITKDNGVVFAYLSKEEPYGIYRFEFSVDGTKIEIPHTITNDDYVKVEDGEGDHKFIEYVKVAEGESGDYKLENGSYVKVEDGTGNYRKLEVGYFEKGKGDYLYQPKYTVDEIKSYREQLRGLGLAKLREKRVTQKFESEINLNQFVYRTDYDVADIVTVQNEHGIQLDARIIEVVETWDETGYSIEPAFEYIGAGGNFGGFGGFGNFGNFDELDWQNIDCLITESVEPIMTESDEYLMYEEGPSATVLSTEYGVALMSETGLLIEPEIATVNNNVENVEPLSDIFVDETSGNFETIKISELPQAEGIGNACCLPIVQEGETKKIYFENIKTNVCESFEIDENGHLIINI